MEMFGDRWPSIKVKKDKQVIFNDISQIRDRKYYCIQYTVRTPPVSNWPNSSVAQVDVNV